MDQLCKTTEMMSFKQMLLRCDYIFKQGVPCKNKIKGVFR